MTTLAEKLISVAGKGQTQLTNTHPKQTTRLERKLGLQL